MHNIILERIRNQTQPTPVALPPPSAPVLPVENPPIEPEELRKLLTSELIEPENIVPQEPLRHFPHIWSFVEWYEPNREKFTSQQQQALDTLVQTRDMVNSGCACKRASREAAATEYFKSFWLNNQNNDLLPMVLKHVGAQQIQFAHFLKHPA